MKKVEEFNMPGPEGLELQRSKIKDKRKILKKVDQSSKNVLIYNKGNLPFVFYHIHPTGPEVQ